MDTKKTEKHVISASAIIPARRDRVYSIIANYREGHPRILPKQFSNLIVDEGGVGAGTVIRFQMRFLGKKQNFRGVVTEPEPGRILVETYEDGSVTSFIVDPGTAPADSRVTIKTELPVRSGFLGRIAGMVAGLLLRPIYTAELQNLARVATGPFGV